MDTNIYSSAARGEKSVLKILKFADLIFVPAIVLGELRSGFLFGTKAKENEAHLIRFLGSPRVKALSVDEQTSHYFARIHIELKKQGIIIPTNDLWIAALALQHDCVLFSKDAHFDAIPQIPKMAK